MPGHQCALFTVFTKLPLLSLEALCSTSKLHLVCERRFMILQFLAISCRTHPSCLQGCQQDAADTLSGAWQKETHKVRPWGKFCKTRNICTTHIRILQTSGDTTQTTGQQSFKLILGLIRSNIWIPDMGRVQIEQRRVECCVQDYCCLETSAWSIIVIMGCGNQWEGENERLR